ncbi:DUF2787 domain-containing protein [Motilimonas sp. 1_MG-2023]|uniref:DUF2787 domain-containing protein n=1 Tax=Motilimonas sp. 1_MG-2023 TaxID=3062672 RepID=UPI0026E2A8D5|nr:DUF2787 domain-containing protein [Motilimonas sp. 1_MG-2023]MDO6528227.1 DUF2787 domain-containing protein [Motilimonas sp. 1_MG-2023]
MNIVITPNKLDVSAQLHASLQQATSTKEIQPDHTQIIFNFRNSSYYQTKAGYHPVEISISREDARDDWRLLYISDLAYFGHPYPELDIEIDFNFQAGIFYMVGLTRQPINHPMVQDFYKTWESNFLAYLSSGVFDDITVNSW